MALGSLVDAGADPDEVRVLLDRLPVGGWDLQFEPVLRCGIAATQAVVHASDTGVVRTAGHIAGLVEEARLPERVTRRALATFRALAEVEGRLHRRAPEQVHFHEVGGLDAIVDVVGTAAALEVLGVDDVDVSLGGGDAAPEHGLGLEPPAVDRQPPQQRPHLVEVGPGVDQRPQRHVAGDPREAVEPRHGGRAAHHQETSTRSGLEAMGSVTKRLRSKVPAGEPIASASARRDP